MPKNITIRTEYAEMSEIVWKKLYKKSIIIENLKSDRPKSKPFSCHIQSTFQSLTDHTALAPICVMMTIIRILRNCVLSTRD
jgi:hypothetical protein